MEPTQPRDERGNRRSESNRKLLIAAKSGKLLKVKEILARGADVNFADKEGNTVLHCAIQSGDLQVVQEILHQIEDVFTENNDNESALTVAHQSGNTKIIQCLQNRILKECSKILEKEFPDTSCHNHASNFVVNTISGHYIMRLKDINTILKVIHIRETVAISLRSLNKMLKFHENMKTYTYIISLELTTFAILVIDEKRGVFYTDSLNNSRHDVITIAEKCLGGNLQMLKWQQNVQKFDSYIYALNNAKIIQSNQDDTLEQLQQRLDNSFINCTEERVFLASLLSAIKRTNDKMEFCLQTLQTLNSCEEDITEFTYKNANAVILFLETFALEDTYPHIFADTEVRKLTKEYYTNYYFQPNKNEVGKPDIRLISDARNKILHYNSKIVNPHDFTSFIAEDMGKTEGGIMKFFKSLEEYTNTVYNKIQNKGTVTNINCNSFLAPLDGKQIIGEDGDLVKIDLAFLLKTFSLRNVEETLFTLTVNILPALNHEKEESYEINRLRNILIHNFQHKNMDEWILLFENFKESIRSKLFKSYYSNEFHKLLKTIKNCAEDDFEISNDFTKKLKNVENQFQSKDIFKYKFSQSLFPEKHDDIQELVDQYLKFMIITYNEVIEIRENDLKKRHVITQPLVKLNSYERREIFESFIKLKNINKFFPALLQNKKKEVFEVIKLYGIRENLFHAIVSLYVDADEKLQHIDERNVKQITDILHFLKRIKTNYELSNKKVLLLYEYFVNGLKFQEEHQTLQGQFNSLPASEMIKVSIGQVVIKINTYNIIADMLEVFYSTYKEYQMKFYNIQEAFADTTFLNYLIDNDVCETEGSYTFKDPNYLRIIIKKMLNKYYTAPYIAELLIKVGNDLIMDSNDLQELIGTLLNNDVFITHLKKLLHITSHKVNLYEVVCNKIKNFEIIYTILKEPKHAEGILKGIIKNAENISTALKIKKTQPITDVLKLLNKISLDFYKTGDYYIALKLLNNDVIKSAHRLLNSEDKMYVIDAKYQIALIKSALGMHEEAKETFQEITESLGNRWETPKYLLSLIEWSYTIFLLDQCDVQFVTQVYERFRCYALGLPYNGDVNNISGNFKNEYNEITSSKRYKDFIFTAESNQYCDIISIREAIPHSKTMKAFKLEKSDDKNALKEYREALEMSNEIYSIQKAHDSTSIIHNMRTIAYIHTRIALIIDDSQKEYHHLEALIKIIQIIKNQKETQTTHSEKQKNKKIVLMYFKNFAETQYARANISKNIDDYQNACNTFTTLYEIQMKILGFDHKYTRYAKCMKDTITSVIRRKFSNSLYQN